jgi:hypothetical protein
LFCASGLRPTSAPSRLAKQLATPRHPRRRSKILWPTGRRYYPEETFQQVADQGILMATGEKRHAPAAAVLETIDPVTDQATSREMFIDQGS